MKNIELYILVSYIESFIMLMSPIGTGPARPVCMLKLHAMINLSILKAKKY